MHHTCRTGVNPASWLDWKKREHTLWVEVRRLKALSANMATRLANSSVALRVAIAAMIMKIGVKGSAAKISRHVVGLALVVMAGSMS
jgi:hypothetical protein